MEQKYSKGQTIQVAARKAHHSRLFVTFIPKSAKFGQYSFAERQIGFV